MQKALGIGFSGLTELGMDCEPRSSGVSQFQRIRLARFLVASPGFHSRLRFDLAHEAGLENRPAFMPFAWLVLSGALAAALAPISGPFVATELFWSRLPAAVRPCGSAAELIGRRVKRFGLGRIGITRWPRE